jgi:hypothetical protein
LLGIREVQGKHRGEVLANVVSGVLKDWKFNKDQTGYYVLDNASNNATATECLVGIRASSAQLRCAGHALNLVVKALFSTEINDMDLDNPSKWKRFEPIHKLHTIAKCIRNSPSMKIAYRDTAEFVQMVQSNNETRFSSVDKMITSVLGKEFAFDKFVKEAAADASDSKTRAKLEANLLSQSDWHQLAEIHDILEPFRRFMVKLQGISSHFAKLIN